MISAIFVDRPRLAIVIAIVTTIAGALALLAIPVAQYPDIVPPQVSVTTSYPGADAGVVDATVAQPIEAQVVGVDKAIYMKSVSGDDGSYSLTVSFELGTNPDINTVNVNNRVQVALATLPPEVQRQGIVVKKKSSALLGVVAVYSPKGTYDALYLSNYVTINLLDTIKSTFGVGDATLWGPQDYAMRAWVQTDRLTGLGLTTGDVISAIQAQNIQAAVGRIGARPISTDQRLQLNIRTKGRLTSVKEFEAIVIRTNPDGSVLRLGDVARLELGAANMDRETRLNGGAASAIAIYQAPGANAIETLGAVKAKLAELQKRFPEDLAWKVTYDPTVFVTDTIHEVQKTLVEAFILVMIVVFLFLGSLRATFIPTIAVPVSLIGTFAVLAAIGYSANTVSLLAVVLAIGIVVDDAIVVVEAVEHEMEKHPELTPAQATKQAMGLITAPIIAITLVLLSVFIPTAFIPGITGQLYSQFAVAVSVSMVISAINALSLSPALCSLILRHRGKPRGVMAWLQNGIDKSRDGYVRVVTPIARRGFIALLLVGGFVLATGGIGSLVPSGFLPDEDQGAFMAEVQLPDAASTNRTLKSIEEVEQTIIGKPWMQSMFTVSGYSILDGLNLPNRGLVVVELKPFAERKDRTLTVFYALAEVNKAFAQIASANVFAFNLPPIMGLGNSSGFEFVVQSLAGAPPVDLAAVARGMMVSAQDVPELANVFTTYAATTPQINLKLDRERAQQLGVSISDIFSAMQTTLGGSYTNDFNLFGRVWQVKVQADAPDRGNVNDVFRVRVRSSNGELVPLQAVANIELITAPSSIVRYNNLRSVVLNGAPAPGYSSGQAIGAMERLAKSTLPAGYGFEWTGTALQEKAASGQTGFILALAVLFAYLFLVGLYESTAIPIAALLSVVVGLFGAMVALYVSGLDNNIFAQIGIVVLIALAAKNAILIIEFAMEERAHGKDIVSAATTAAALRFRAVMMTSFAFILGLVPLVIASGAGAATQRAVGTAVFGGMIAASMLGIFVIPGLYVALQTFREKVKGLGAKPATVQYKVVDPEP
jgi:hydrophobe/amphiphile efflux-1 (HAE1) family protein